MGLFDNLFKPRPDGGVERVVDAPLKASSLMEKAAPAADDAPPEDTVATFLQPKGYTPGSTSSVVGGERQGFVPVLPTGKKLPARERKLSTPTPAPGSSYRFVLNIGDVFSRLPAHLLRPGPHDLKRELHFQIADLSPDIARGRPMIALSCIAEQCPDLFHAPISDDDDMAIRLPLQKLVEQVGRMRGLSNPVPPGVAPPAAPAPAVAPAKTPVAPAAKAEMVAPPPTPLPVRPPEPKVAAETESKRSISFSTTPKPAPVVAPPAAPPAAAPEPPVATKPSPAPTIVPPAATPLQAVVPPSPVVAATPAAATPAPVIPPVPVVKAESMAKAEPAAELEPAVKLAPEPKQELVPTPEPIAKAEPKLEAVVKPEPKPLPVSVPEPLAVEEPVPVVAAVPPTPPAPPAPVVQNVAATVPVPVEPAVAVLAPIGAASEPAAPASVAPPVPEAAPVRPAPPAPLQLPQLTLEADLTGEMIRLSLAAILPRVPREMISGPVPRIDEGYRIRLPFGPIEKQLGSGSVSVSSAAFCAALPGLLQHYFSPLEGVNILLPLEEIFQNLPGVIDDAPLSTAPDVFSTPSPVAVPTAAPAAFSAAAPAAASAPIERSSKAPIELAPLMPTGAILENVLAPVTPLPESAAASASAEPITPTPPAPHAEEHPAVTSASTVSETAKLPEEAVEHENQPAAVAVEKVERSLPLQPLHVPASAAPPEAVVEFPPTPPVPAPESPAETLLPALAAEKTTSEPAAGPESAEEIAAMTPLVTAPPAPSAAPKPLFEVLPSPEAPAHAAPAHSHPVTLPVQPQEETDQAAAFVPDQPPQLIVAAAMPEAAPVLRATIPAPQSVSTFTPASAPVQPPQFFRPVVLPPPVFGQGQAAPTVLAPKLGAGSVAIPGAISLAPVASVADAPSISIAPFAVPSPRIAEPAVPAEIPRSEPAVTPPQPAARPAMVSEMRSPIMPPALGILPPQQAPAAPASDLHPMPAVVAAPPAVEAPAAAPIRPTEHTVPVAPGKPDAAAPEVGDLHLHLPPLSQRSAPTPARDPSRPALPISRFDQHSLQSLFMTDESLDFPKVARLAAALPGVQGCLVAVHGETFAGGALPDGLQLGTLRGLASQVGAAAEVLPIGELKNFTLYGGQYSVSFFECASVCLCAVHRARSFVPGVREKLVALVEELARS